MPDETEEQRLTRKLADTTKSDAALKDIQDTLSSFDGIALGDAFKLAGLIIKYGDDRAAETIGPVMDVMLSGLTRSLDKQEGKKREPWMPPEGGL